MKLSLQLQQVRAEYVVESDQMALLDEKRMRVMAIAFWVASLAFAVAIMCITGPMMALSNPCETLQTTAVASGSTAGAHAIADEFSHMALPALEAPVAGFPELVEFRKRGRPTAPPTPLSLNSIPLRA